MGEKAKNLLLLKKAGFNVPMLISCPSTIRSERDLTALADDVFPLDTLFAVRSSAANEDASDSAMAGYYYSATGVSRKALYKEYRRVVDSYQGASGSVIVQQFIPSKKAGVIFTDRGDGKMVCNAAPGLCNTVVQGLACDEYVINSEGKVEEATIAPDKTALYFKGKFINQYVGEVATLTKTEISQLFSVANAIADFFNAPQDIEWCFFHDELYILQSRPVTRAIIEKRERVRYDSANIAESYSGIVKPLTTTFAVQIYKTVYQNLLIASGLSKRKILKHRDIFENLTASFYGRLYYNMNNWYLMMSFMPGYRRNKNNLEEMITSNVRQEIERSVKPTLLLRISYPFILIYKLIFFNRKINRFIRDVKEALHYYNDLVAVDQWDYQQCYLGCEKLMRTLLEQWHIPVENDFLMMTFLGKLRERFDEDLLKDLLKFDNVSSRQVEALSDLAKAFYSIPAMREAIDQGETTIFEQQLSAYSGLQHMLKQYFSVYGGRFANELKLESPDISDDTEKLIAILELYKNYSPKPKEASHFDNIKLKRSSRWLLKRFRKYAAQREVLRLLRSNCFAVMRKLFVRTGVIFHENNLIDKPEDIFWLTLSEVFSSKEISKHIDFKSVIVQRKRDYLYYEKIQPPTWFEIDEGDITPPLAQKEDKGATVITARPCTSGIIKGKAKVFKTFYLPEKIDFDILVARHTDPGWTPLIGLVKGLVIEHGGILSHAAIVSRELGIPTVIGAANATELIHDYDYVTIDGKTGMIKIEKK